MGFVLWVKDQVDWAKSFFNEPSGKASNKRLIGAGVVLVFLIAYLRIALATSSITDIPSNWSFLIAGILGLGIIDKVVSKKNGTEAK